MKLIIDIDEDIYKARQHWVTNPKMMLDKWDIAIANGTPIPDNASILSVTEFADKCRECGKMREGHWIIIDDCEKFIAKCSECGRIEDSRMISKYPYCHCGAKMVEPQESEE